MKAATGWALGLALTAAAGLARADDCKILTAGDIKTVAGVQVSNIPFNSKPGAGGKCANFVDSKGKLYLGVTRLNSAADYKNEVAAVPSAVYPTRVKVVGVGDEAVLMSGAGGAIRYFLARKGSHGVVLFPFGRQPSDAELGKLAVIALAR